MRTYLDNRSRVRHFAELVRGTIEGTAVHPRVVVREALKHHATAVIFAHNQPVSRKAPLSRRSRKNCWTN